jgi:tellurite resistance protein
MLMDTLEAATLGHPDEAADEAVAAAVALHALTVSWLEPKEREAHLQAIEDQLALRRDVALFRDVRPATFNRAQ